MEIPGRRRFLQFSLLLTALAGVQFARPCNCIGQEATLTPGDRIRVLPLIRPKDRVTGSMISVSDDTLTFEARGDTRRLALSDIETPRLNRDIVAEASDETYDLIIDRLEEGFSRVIPCIDSLNDQELLEAGVFTWAGRWPVSRWISINTARQYVTARTYVRRAVRMHAGAPGLGGAS